MEYMHVWPCGVKGHLLWNGFVEWMRLVFISSVLDKNWNFKSVTWSQRCHKQESAGCRDACNEKSRIFAQPIKTSRVSYWSGKLASSSMLFNVGLDVSVKCSSSSPHFSTQSRLKMGAHWCDCGGPWKDTEIFRADVTTSLNRSVVLELDYFFWCGSLGVIAYLQTETDHTQGLCIDNHQLCFIESSHVNIERSNISPKNSVF